MTTHEMACVVPYSIVYALVSVKLVTAFVGCWAGEMGTGVAGEGAVGVV